LEEHVGSLLYCGCRGIFSRIPVRKTPDFLTDKFTFLSEDIGTEKAKKVSELITDEYLTVFHEFPVMVWRLDMDGRAEYFNHAWLEFTGREMQSIAGEGWVECLHPDDRQRYLKSYQQAVKGHKAVELECRTYRYDGQYRWTIYSGRPYNKANGEIAGYIGSCHDITEQKIVSENLRVFTHRLVVIQEAERWRISRELHDEAGQSLTALMINLDMLQADLPGGNEILQQRVEACIDLVHETIDLIRHLAQDLRPPALDTLGLNLTLEGYCQEFTRRTHIPIIYHGFETQPMEDEANITFYRFLQEGLRNVVDHPQVNQASVILCKEENVLRLTIEDDGQDIEVEPASNLPLELSAEPQSDRLGLLEMRERFDLLGGAVEVQARPEGGIRFIGWLPVDRFNLQEMIHD
jgi:PAS domain S-box-containing protein